MITIGVDPGLHGAIALLSDGHLQVFDIPLMEITKNRKAREVVDEQALENMIRFLASLNPRIVTIEQVGGITGQSASAAFNFGDIFGVIRTFFRAYAKCETQRPMPQKWKKYFGIGSLKGDSVKIADNLFPGYSDLFRGPRGALKHDRAEAALLAYYGNKLIVEAENEHKSPIHSPRPMREVWAHNQSR